MFCYRDAMAWLFRKLPMYQNQGKNAYKPKLDNIISICKYLGDPHENIPAIHIAGTNGKGFYCSHVSFGTSRSGI